MKKLFFLVTLIAISLTSVQAQDNFSVKDFEMSVAGTSTLHDWVSDVTKVKVDANLEMEDRQLKSISSLKAVIPVKGIVSTKGRIMDGKTYDALKSDKHPNITFRLLNASINSSQANAPKVKANGYLEIAGKSRAVSLVVDGKVNSDGSITFTGSKSVKMTDYGMDPPTALMGSIKTGDEVTIDYSVTLVPTR